MLKTSGYDHVVVTGRSETPVYLCIQGETHKTERFRTGVEAAEPVCQDTK